MNVCKKCVCFGCDISKCRRASKQCADSGSSLTELRSSSPKFQGTTALWTAKARGDSESTPTFQRVPSQRPECSPHFDTQNLNIARILSKAQKLGKSHVASTQANRFCRPSNYCDVLEMMWRVGDVPDDFGSTLGSSNMGHRQTIRTIQGSHPLAGPLPSSSLTVGPSWGVWIHAGAAHSREILKSKDMNRSEIWIELNWIELIPNRITVSEKDQKKTAVWHRAGTQKVPVAESLAHPGHFFNNGSGGDLGCPQKKTSKVGWDWSIGWL